MRKKKRDFLKHVTTAFGLLETALREDEVVEPIAPIEPEPIKPSEPVITHDPNYADCPEVEPTLLSEITDEQWENIFGAYENLRWILLKENEILSSVVSENEEPERPEKPENTSE